MDKGEEIEHVKEEVQEIKKEVKEQVNNIKKINNFVIRRPPWIITDRTMSTECYKLTMNMIDKQPPKPLTVYKKIKINTKIK
jgi:hypothetical protein